jgi:hydrogenase-4 component F
MAYLLVILPLALAVATWAFPRDRWRPWLVPLGGLVHLAATLYAVSLPPGTVAGLDDWLLLDPLGKVFLVFQSGLFFLCALYAPGYLGLRGDRPNRIFCANLLVSLAMMSLVSLSHHLGLLWVAMEATTLVMAPAIYFNQNARSLEATWKFLLVGSVGIALALLGSLFLAYASLKPGAESTLLFDHLVREAPQLSAPWLHAAFVLLFVGYGTKMGLAPMHTWKPDAYGEAPGLVGTLLAGGMTSCAFLAILRLYQICQAQGPQGGFAREIMIVMGLLSMAVAAVFMVRQRDFKRMLAYSSVEHMGVLVLGVGIGGLAVYGALLHVINNGLTKGVFFLSAGNIHRAYGSKLTDEVQGALHRVPLSGGLFLAGFLAITGSPPFGPFISEFTIVREAMLSGQFLAGGLFLLLLGIVFVGMGVTVLAVVQGPPPQQATTEYRDSFATGAPVVLFLALVLLLGLHVPEPLETVLREAAAFVEGIP